MKYLKIIAFIAVVIFVKACENPFEYSVYQANVKDGNKNTTTKNLDLLKDIQVASGDFKFAFIADTHYFYDNLKSVVNDINKNDEILFVIVGGDLTEQALLKEYEMFYDIMKTLDKPYLTVIGNHDYKSNGNVIYKSMFGDYNYTFQFNNNKFILFDNIIWESNKDPDFSWLSKELSDHALYNQVFVIAHIPPFGDQLTTEIEQKYRTLLEDNHVSLSIHGHTHTQVCEKNIVSYLSVDSMKEAAYSIVSVEKDAFSVEHIKL